MGKGKQCHLLYYFKANGKNITWGIEVGAGNFWEENQDLKDLGQNLTAFDVVSINYKTSYIRAKQIETSN